MAICSTTGAIMRHGPHHSAQKSTSTGFSFSRTVPWKLSAVISSTPSAIYASFPDAMARAGSSLVRSSSPIDSSQRSASIAAMHPLPAAVIACL